MTTLRAFSACVLALCFAATSLACAAPTEADETSDQAAPSPPVDDTTVAAEDTARGSAPATGGATVTIGPVKTCVESCENWTVVKNGRVITGTSCSCIFQ